MDFIICPVLNRVEKLIQRGTTLWRPVIPLSLAQEFLRKISRIERGKHFTRLGNLGKNDLSRLRIPAD